MSEPVLLRDTANYRVTFYAGHADQLVADQLVIVFISAGRLAPGEPVEEFRRTLEAFGPSVAFVLDRHALWFNYAESAEMWEQLRALAARFTHVATIGESMGGCGALEARREIAHVSRTLASAPQYSIAKPFVNFDERYEPTSCRIDAFYTPHYADAPRPEECLLLYGTEDWRDYIHSAMFAARGFRPAYVSGSGHNVSAFLKALPGNGLRRLVAALLDWETPFGPDTAAALFPDLLAPSGLSPSGDPPVRRTPGLMNGLAEDFARATGHRLGSELSRDRPATQSSTSPWSRSPDPAHDAAGAVSGGMDGTYSFHTGLDHDPWWQVDLGGNCTVQEVRLFNLVGERALMERCARLRIQTTAEDGVWHTVLERDDPAPFGGIDGHPLVWSQINALVARLVRVSAIGQTYLHLDAVQVFGHGTALPQG